MKLPFRLNEETQNFEDLTEIRVEVGFKEFSTLAHVARPLPRPEVASGMTWPELLMKSLCYGFQAVSNEVRIKRNGYCRQCNIQTLNL